MVENEKAQAVRTAREEYAKFIKHKVTTIKALEEQKQERLDELDRLIDDYIDSMKTKVGS